MRTPHHYTVQQDTAKVDRTGMCEYSSAHSRTYISLGLFGYNIWPCLVPSGAIHSRGKLYEWREAPDYHCNGEPSGSTPESHTFRLFSLSLEAHTCEISNKPDHYNPIGARFASKPYPGSATDSVVSRLVQSFVLILSRLYPVVPPQTNLKSDISQSHWRRCSTTYCLPCITHAQKIFRGANYLLPYSYFTVSLQVV
jgi:hypothetical protein